MFLTMLPALSVNNSSCPLHFYMLSAAQADKQGRTARQKTDKQTDTETDSQTERQTDSQTDRQADTKTDRQTDRQTATNAERQIDRQSDRQTGSRWTDGKTDSHKDKQTGRPTNRQTDRQKNRQSVTLQNLWMHHCPTRLFPNCNGVFLFFYLCLSDLSFFFIYFSFSSIFSPKKITRHLCVIYSQFTRQTCSVRDKSLQTRNR